MTDMKVTLEDGKYELIYEERSGNLTAKRSGAVWQDYTGSKFMYLLLAKITELKEENENIRRANLDCVENFNELMKDYKELHTELLRIEEREYHKQVIESR